jgi:hypothetical protein
MKNEQLLKEVKETIDAMSALKGNITVEQPKDEDKKEEVAPKQPTGEFTVNQDPAINAEKIEEREAKEEEEKEAAKNPAHGMAGHKCDANCPEYKKEEVVEEKKEEKVEVKKEEKVEEKKEVDLSPVLEQIKALAEHVKALTEDVEAIKKAKTAKKGVITEDEEEEVEDKKMTEVDKAKAEAAYIFG